MEEVAQEPKVICNDNIMFLVDYAMLATWFHFEWTFYSLFLLKATIWQIIYVKEFWNTKVWQIWKLAYYYSHLNSLITGYYDIILISWLVK